MASCEEELTSIEAEGYLTLLVAKSGRIIGVVAFLDAVHKEAETLVEILKEERVEPILISGDPRATTETLGLRLGIEHVRPEVHAGERPELVRKLAEGGSKIAVLGRAGQDDPSLEASEVALALEGPSDGLNRAIQIAGEGPLGAALAIRAARKLTLLAQRLEIVSALPWGLGALMVIVGLLPIFALPPLATLAAATLYFFTIRRA
jgi:cation transport ATPase